VPPNNSMELPGRTRHAPCKRKSKGHAAFAPRLMQGRGTVGLLAWFKQQRQWRRDHVATFGTVTQRQPDGLSLFQHEALKAIAQFIEPTSFKRVAMQGDEGAYLVSSMGDRGAEIYIYPNEAQICGVAPEARLEEWAYRTLNELLHALVEECATRVAQR